MSGVIVSEAMERPLQNSVLRRKATAAKEVWQARAMSPSKALRLSVARAADDLWDLAVAASGIALTEEPQDDVIGSLPEDGLLLLLEGPEGLIGAAHLPFPVVSGLIEAQTLGRINPKTPAARKATRTDAAMVAPLIDGVMERFDALLAEAGGSPWVPGFRYGTMMDSPRMLSLALKASDFHVIRFALDLAALRDGEALLMLPVAAPVPDAPSGDAGRAGALQAQVMQAPTELRAVLHRVKMPLSGVSALKVGMMLEIPRDALAQTEIEVSSGTVIGTVRLGQVNGMRAIRMGMPGGAEALTPPGAGSAPSEEADPMFEVAMTPEPAMPDPDMPDAAPDPAPVPAPIPDTGAVEQVDDLLGDLPDLGDLPGMDSNEAGEDLPDIGIMPMADLPVID